MIDTHCHVHFRGFDDDRDEVVSRTLECGVFMIVVGTQSDTSKAAVELAESRDGIWCAVGLHPSHTSKQVVEEDGVDGFLSREEEFDDEFYGDLVRSSEKVVAIGEIGLDYYRLPDDEKESDGIISRQKAAFRAALDFADSVGLPVILHVRDAHDDAYTVVKEYLDAGKLARKGVVHCFTGSMDEALRWHDLGFMTSITGIATFGGKKDAEGFTELQRVVQAIPDDMLMVETDAPYLAPEPHRGRRCEPWMVTDVAKKVAELRGVSIQEIEDLNAKNAKKLFGIE